MRTRAHKQASKLGGGWAGEELEPLPIVRLDMLACFVRDTRVNQSIEEGKKAASCLPAQWFNLFAS